MFVDQISRRQARPTDDVDHPVEAPPATDTVEALLLGVARGNQHAFVALQSRMAGLVHLNVRRVLRDASRSETVTRETFDNARQDAVHFDPRRDSAQTWLLTRAHEHATDDGRRTDALDPKEHP
ncbi:MAG: hypothetical protein WDZ26_05440 [Nitriliruptoraceae bacterium]